MPARKKHQYSVSVDFPVEQRAELRYMGSSERLASWHFYRAARSAKPGATVLLKEDGEIVLRFAVPG